MNRNEIIADTLHKAGVAGSMQLADLIAEAIGQNENILAGYLEQAFVAGERAEFDRLDKREFVERHTEDSDAHQR